MTDETVVEEIVAKFFFDTCRLHTGLSQPAAEAVLRCVQIARKYPPDGEADSVPLTTGSVAEFYIEPMLPHIGDIDVMGHYSTQLAIPRGHPSPTQLPAEFHNYVHVFEIIDSHFPGYVYLQLRYLLTDCVDDDKYNAVEYDREMYLSNCLNSNGGKSTIHGPAVMTPSSIVLVGLPVDAVRSVRCLKWPPQAADWPTRHRNCGWPHSATVDRVVSNGCDVVGVAHRLCRQDEWMSSYQHRLSFSRAEIVLINSWMPAQQLIYHILRVFVKTERLTDSADITGISFLSNYHIKTLLLWASELKSPTWWADDLNLVRICMHLLHVLAAWLTNAQCQHYFISGCNLLDKTCDVTNIGCQLMSIDATWLSKWCADNYIRKCSQLCPNNISRLFDDVSTFAKLQNAVSSVVAWRLNNTPFDLWRTLHFLEFEMVACIDPLTARLCACWMTELTKMDSRLCLCFTAVAFLHVAYKSRYGFSDELMDVLATLFGQFVYKRYYSNNSATLLSLDQAAKLMKFVGNKSLSTMSLIVIELSKAYLYRALICQDSDSDSIYCLANVYLAVLYYTTGQYQTAMDHCTLVMLSQDHSQCSSHIVQGERLPKIDDNIDNVLGLAVFYQHVRTAALNEQCHSQYVSALTTELLAYYLHTKFPLVALRCQLTKTSTGECKQYQTRVNDIEQLFVCDVLLFVSLRHLLKKKHYRRSAWQNSHQLAMNTTEYNSSYMVELLQKAAVEHLTTFRQMDVQDFGSVATIVTTDFQALYAYKRGDYQRCLQLSTQNVHTLFYAARNRMPDFLVFPEFIQLLDDDIVSLNALILIVYPERRYCDNRRGCISQLTLSLYLMTQCQIMLRHSETALAQTVAHILVAQGMHPVCRALDRLVLKMTAHKAVTYTATTMMNEILQVFT